MERKTPHSRVRFRFSSRKPLQKWLPVLLGILRGHDFKNCKFVDETLELTGGGDCMETADRVASFAGLACQQEPRFWKLGCRVGREKVCEYKICLLEGGRVGK